MHRWGKSIYPPSCHTQWPIMLSLLNQLRHIRNAFGNLFLVGIIPGNGTKEASSLSPYLEILVDEHAQQKAPFQMKVCILHYILDYPGIGKVFNVCGSGAYKGCHLCDITGECPLTCNLIFHPLYGSVQ